MSRRRPQLRRTVVERGAEWQDGGLSSGWVGVVESLYRHNGIWESTEVASDLAPASLDEEDLGGLCEQVAKALPPGSYSRLVSRQTLLTSNGELQAIHRLRLLEIHHPALGYILHTGWSGASPSPGSELAVVAQTAGDELRALAGAEPLVPGRRPVALDGEAAGVLAAMGVGYLLEGDRIVAGTSRLAGIALGEEIADPRVSITDDPTAAAAPVAFSHDDEGTPASPAPLVSRGRMAGYLTDQTCADLLAVPATGHARGESCQLPPVPRVASIEMESGTATREELLEAAAGGFWGQGVSAATVDVATGIVHLTVRCAWRLKAGGEPRPVTPFTLRLQFPEAWDRLRVLGAQTVSTVRPMGKGRPLQTVAVGLKAPDMALEEVAVG